MSDARIQAELLNAVLTGSWPRRAPLGWTLGGTLVLAGLTAWLGLVLRWWKALVGVAVLASGSAVALLLSPALLGVVLPPVPPLAPAVVARSEERRVGKEGRSRWSPYH